MKGNKVIYFNKALNWIYNNTLEGKGIIVNSKVRKIYPEVSGYYIPSLLQWGEKELALTYARNLCTIQKDDGSWTDCEDKYSYVFDSAQILKGLIAIRPIMPEVDAHIIKGCDWILSNMQPDGRLTTPSKDAWGNNESFCCELIHIYCLEPIRKAGEIFKRLDYIESVNKILTYYKREEIEKIENFDLLSHFYAYVMEGLYDLGETEMCYRAMLQLEKFRNRKGGIPGLNDVPWVCSTGMFQLAVVWYKLGDLVKGDSLFNYALSLQNNSGGWYGSYPAPSIFAKFYRGKNRPYYMPNAEISWAVKYFLDALALKEKLEFEKQASFFLDEIDENDGRYVLVKKLIKIQSEDVKRQLRICDVGCGKGRYLKRLALDYPENEYYATDISQNVTKNISCVKEFRLGRMTDIPYQDSFFDFVYVCEAYEHAVNLHSAFKELYRIVKSGGRIVIIDKPIEKLGQLKIDEWEQWISDEMIREFVEECGGDLIIEKSVPYEGKNDGLFRAWIVNVKKAI